VSAIALVVSVALGTSERLAVFIVIALTVLYTFEGGMKAWIWTGRGAVPAVPDGEFAHTGLAAASHPRRNGRKLSQVAAVSGNKLRVLDFSWNLGDEV